MNHLIQIDDEIREATEEEIALIGERALATEQMLQEAENRALAREAVLNKLGLTSEEAAVLLG